MIDHVMLMVKDKEKSERFYKSLLDIVGLSLIHSTKEYAGFGKAGRVPFWIKQAEINDLTERAHIAFSASFRSLVDQFHETALRLGAKSNGEPGPRLEHGKNYYATYIHDLDGHNIEAVCYAEVNP